jgi:thymidine kinase
MTKQEYFSILGAENTLKIIEWLNSSNEQARIAKDIYNILTEIDFNDELCKSFLKMIRDNLNISIPVQKFKYKFSKNYFPDIDSCIKYCSTVLNVPAACTGSDDDYYFVQTSSKIENIPIDHIIYDGDTYII